MDFKSKRLFWILIAPTVLFILALGIYPAIYGVTVSLKSYSLTSPPETRHFIGAANYSRLLFGSDIYFWDSMRVTFIYTFAVVVLELVIGFALAMLLSKDLVGKNVARSLLLLPLGVSAVIVGMIWRLMYNQSYGVINHMLASVGLPEVPWLSSSFSALPAVILADVWQWTPFVFLIILSGIVGLPKSPYEAAAIDGASGWMVFRRVTLPLLKPVILVAVLLRGIDAFKTFDQIFVLTQGGPGTSTEIISLYGYKMGFKFFNMGQAAALAWIMLVILVLGATAFMRVINRQGVKM